MGIWIIGRGLQGFALATNGLGGQAAAMGGGEVAKAMLAEPEAEDSHGIRACKEEGGGGACAIRGAGGVGADGAIGGGGEGGGLMGGEPA